MSDNLDVQSGRGTGREWFGAVASVALPHMQLETNHAILKENTVEPFCTVPSPLPCFLWYGYCSHKDRDPTVFLHPNPLTLHPNPKPDPSPVPPGGELALWAWISSLACFMHSSSEHLSKTLKKEDDRYP